MVSCDTRGKPLFSTIRLTLRNPSIDSPTSENGKSVPQKILSRSAIRYSSAQRKHVVELPGTVEDSRDLAVHVGLLARNDDALLVPRVAHVGHDHLQVWMSARHIVDIDRSPQLGWRIAGERRAHVHGQRQVPGDAILVDRLHARVVQVHAVVDGPVLDALEAEILDRMPQQLHAIGPARIDAGEADELVRILCARPRR